MKDKIWLPEKQFRKLMPYCGRTFPKALSIYTLLLADHQLLMEPFPINLKQLAETSSYSIKMIRRCISLLVSKKIIELVHKGSNRGDNHSVYKFVY